MEAHTNRAIYRRFPDRRFDDLAAHRDSFRRTHVDGNYAHRQEPIKRTGREHGSVNVRVAEAGILASSNMIGTTLGHYEIEAKIGQGGMGTVYRARDTV